MTGRWTARGLGTFAVGCLLLVGGLTWRYPGLVGLGGALVALALVALVAVRLPAPVEAERTVAPVEVTRFAPCGGTLLLRRTGGRVAVQLDAVERVAGEPVPVRVPRLGRGQHAEVEYPIPTDRRGVVTVGPLLLRRRGPAGLAGAVAELGGTVDIRILPRVLPVRGLPSGARRGHLGVDERVEHGGTNLVGLREYVPGDDLRRLHWATSARTGTLMVREDADPARAHLVVLLDDRASSHPDGEIEDAVEVAASLASAAYQAGHPVRLLTISGRLDLTEPGAVDGVPPGPARGLVSRLADLEADGSDRTPPGLPSFRHDVVVVVSGSGADPGPLLMEATRAELGVLAVVDRAPDRSVATHGSVLVLRGPRGEDLLAAWDRAVFA